MKDFEIKRFNPDNEFDFLYKLYDNGKWDYIDQLSDDPVVFNYRQLKSYLRKNYGITPRMYYNIIVKRNIDYQPLCRICGKPAQFYSVQMGYSNTCDCEDCRSKSKSISMSESIRASVENGTYSSFRPEVKEKIRQANKRLAEEGRLGFQSERNRENNRLAIKKLVDKGEFSLQKTESCIKAQMKSVISKNLGKECVLYLAWSQDNRLKIGVSSDYLHRFGTSDYRCIHKVLSGNIEYLAEIEAKIKLHYNCAGEYFDSNELTSMIKLIRKYK